MSYRCFIGIDTNWKFVAFTIFEISALNAQKFKGSRDYDNPPFWISGVLSGVGTVPGAHVPNFKSVTLVVLELLASNRQKFNVSRDPGHAPNPIFTQSIKYLLHVHSELAA